MKSSEIELSTTYRQFAFEKISREIESCNDIVVLTLNCFSNNRKHYQLLVIIM
jgi:hypothetical protein